MHSTTCTTIQIHSVRFRLVFSLSKEPNAILSSPEIELYLFFSFFSFLFLLRFNPRQIWLCILWPFHFTNADKRSIYRTYARNRRRREKRKKKKWDLSSIFKPQQAKCSTEANRGRIQPTVERKEKKKRERSNLLVFHTTAWQRHKEEEYSSLYTILTGTFTVEIAKGSR